jgi:hypothetical protein
VARFATALHTHRWFENSSHSPLFEETERFNQFLIGEALPVAQQWGAVARCQRKEPQLCGGISDLALRSNNL